MSLLIVAYDISNDHRRRRVARTLERWGARIQKSVFEVRADADEVAKLRLQLGSLLAKGDRVDIVPVDLRAGHKRHSWQRPVSQPGGIRVVSPFSVLNERRIDWTDFY